MRESRICLPRNRSSTSVSGLRTAHSKICGEGSVRKPTEAVIEAPPSLKEAFRALAQQVADLYREDANA